MPSNSRTGGERSNAERAPHQIDVHVGAQIRLRRTLLGITQGRLAELIGLTFQQIQKYEGGANRIGASRLFEIGAALDVPVSFFFQGLESQSEEQAAKCDGGPIDAKEDVAREPPRLPREGLELLRAYLEIEDQQMRALILGLTKAIANSRHGVTR